MAARGLDGPGGLPAYALSPDFQCVLGACRAAIVGVLSPCMAILYSHARRGARQLEPQANVSVASSDRERGRDYHAVCRAPVSQIKSTGAIVG